MPPPSDRVSKTRQGVTSKNRLPPRRSNWAPAKVPTFEGCFEDVLQRPRVTVR